MVQMRYISSSNPAIERGLLFHRRTSSTPMGYSFSCTRTEKKTAEMKDIYHRIINNETHKMISEHAFCKTDHHCTPNKRGALFECGCTPLSRTKINGRMDREKFEDHVIDSVFEILQKSKSLEFHLRLGLFCSGGLLGEEALLFRLAAELKKYDYQGEIELFLVDTEYKTAIETGKLLTTDHGRAINHFLKELAGCLPKKIAVSGTFFKNIDDYKNLAITNRHYRHDLFLGEDTEASSHHLEKIEKDAGTPRAVKPLVLVKSDGPNFTCTVGEKDHDCVSHSYPYFPKTFSNAEIRERDLATTKARELASRPVAVPVVKREEKQPEPEPDYTGYYIGGGLGLLIIAGVVVAAASGAFSNSEGDGNRRRSSPVR